MKYQVPKVVKENKVKKEAQAKFLKIFLIEGSLYLLTAVLAIVASFELNKLAQLKKVYLPATSWQDFLLSFLFITLLILVLVFYKKAGKLKGLIYKGLFVLTVFWGGMTILDLFVPIFGSLLVMAVLIFLWLEFPSVWVHDI